MVKLVKFSKVFATLLKCLSENLTLANDRKSAIYDSLDPGYPFNSSIIVQWIISITDYKCIWACIYDLQVIKSSPAYYVGLQPVFTMCKGHDVNIQHLTAS